MDNAADDELWIFFHLRKAGGTTLNGHFKKYLLWDRSFVLQSNWGEVYRKTNGRLPLHERSLEARREVRVLSGHRTYYGIHQLIPGKKPIYVALMRDPAAQIVSAYNFDRSRGKTDLTFRAWYKYYTKNHANFITNFYAHRLIQLPLQCSFRDRLNMAKKLFTQCRCLLLTENLDKDLPLLFKRMGLPLSWDNYRVAGNNDGNLNDLNHIKKDEKVGRHFVLDEVTKQQIYSDHPFDFELYAYAIELSKQQIFQFDS